MHRCEPGLNEPQCIKNRSTVWQGVAVQPIEYLCIVGCNAGAFVYTVNVHSGWQCTKMHAYRTLMCIVIMLTLLQAHKCGVSLNEKGVT